MHTEDEMLRENNVYIKNLAPDVDDAKLLEMSKVSCQRHTYVSKHLYFSAK